MYLQCALDPHAIHFLETEETHKKGKEQYFRFFQNEHLIAHRSCCFTEIDYENMKTKPESQHVKSA